MPAPDGFMAMTAIEQAIDEMRNSHQRLYDNAIRRGAASYDRERDLPKLFPAHVWSGRSDAEIRDMLRSAITAGQRALRVGHWAASGSRLTALRQALAGEELRASEQLPDAAE